MKDESQGDHVVLGYDARCCIEDVEKFWNEERRQIFLIETEAKKPLSTDNLVWPSVISHTLPERIVNSWIGPLNPLWENLQYLKDSIPQGIRCHILAITLFKPYCPSLEEWRWRDIGNEEPSEIDESWTFLGFDVSDASFLSSLTNCHKNFLAAKENKFFLNKYHLFEEAEVADRFKDISNGTIEDHAPFFVYGLWIVETLGCALRC